MKPKTNNYPKKKLMNFTRSKQPNNSMGKSFMIWSNNLYSLVIIDFSFYK